MLANETIKVLGFGIGDIISFLVIAHIVLVIAMIITFFKMYTALRNIEDSNRSILDEIYQIHGEAKRSNMNSNPYQNYPNNNGYFNR